MSKLEGREITVRGKTYTMPDLPYAAYEEHDAMIKIVDIARSLDAMKGNPLLHPFTGKTLKDSRELIMLALRGNYPDIDEEDFKKKLRVVDVIRAVTVLITRELEIQEIIDTDQKNVDPQTSENKTEKK